MHESSKKIAALLDDFPVLILLPPFLFFLMARYLHFTTLFASRGVQVLMALELFALGFKVLVGRCSISQFRVLIWALLFLFFLMPGAYLEYPADSWEHLSRIFSWNRYSRLIDNTEMNRFSYFFSWSLLQDLPIMHRRLGLAFVGAFGQWLMTFQFFKFLKGWNIRTELIPLHVFAFVGLFGTNLFSMRYYSLSGTLLGYSAYLAMLQVLSGKYPLCATTKLLLALLTLFAAFNHPQTLLFILISALAYFLLIVIRRLPDSLILFYVVLMAVFGVLSGIGFQILFPEVYAKFPEDTFTRIGIFNVLKPHNGFLETWGLHGILTVILSPLLFRRFPFFVFLTWVPVFLLFGIPVSILLIANFFHTDTPYRLLFLFPTSVMTVQIVDWYTKKIERALSKAGITPLFFTTLIILLFALPYQYPWRGRLYFQLYPSPGKRSLDWIDKTANWFADRPNLLKDCYLMGDDISVFAVYSFLGLYNYSSNRIPPLRLTYRFVDWDLLIKASRAKEFMPGISTCGFLVPMKHQIPIANSSSIGGMSRHWPSFYADLNTQVDFRFVENGDELVVKSGYAKVEVPPFYYLYVPPSRVALLNSGDTH